MPEGTTTPLPVPEPARTAGELLARLCGEGQARLERRFQGQGAEEPSSWPGVDARRLGMCGAQTVPGLLPHADHPDVFAPIADRPLRIQWGLLDALMDLDATRAGLAHIHRSYEPAGRPERFEVDQFRGGHPFDLGPVRTGSGPDRVRPLAVRSGQATAGRLRPRALAPGLPFP